VNLVSGGLDSTLIGVLAKESDHEVYTLFIDNGQRAAAREWETCKVVHEKLDLPSPKKMDLKGYGEVIVSGLTNGERHVKDDAFTPGRNLMFLLMGGAYAYQLGVSSVSIGLLAEEFSLFPDQRRPFLDRAEAAIAAAMGRQIKVLTPLIEFGKEDVVRLAQAKGVTGTYSCHVGDSEPCGQCIACCSPLPKGNKEPHRQALHEAIEAERSRLSQAQSMLECLYLALDKADDSDPKHQIYYPDVVEMVLGIVRESVNRLDSVYIRPLVEAV
jgi:7-cyano-7-deazaguanine synthase